eukprot:TRINITY_DN113_c0_g1_i1.p1 TRINITY_DN113_c0_g1~~TRINITY_DN113_c0_g1_i1.p1  ORF type:complete len:1135 (-),score=363.87 TRINITY_DN113_c0_g1_i1:1506-4910(-)
MTGSFAHGTAHKLRSMRGQGGSPALAHIPHAQYDRSHRQPQPVPAAYDPAARTGPSGPSGRPEQMGFHASVSDMQVRHLQSTVDNIQKENDMMRMEIKAQNEYHRQLLQSLNFCREELRASRDTLARYQAQHQSDQRKILRYQATMGHRGASGARELAAGPGGDGLGVQAQRAAMNRRDGKGAMRNIDAARERSMTTTPTAGMYGAGAGASGAFYPGAGGADDVPGNASFSLAELEECRHLAEVMDRVESMSVRDQAASFEAMAPELFAISRIAVLGHDLGAVLSTDHVIKVILEAIPELVNVSHVELYLMDEASQELVRQPVGPESIRLGLGVEAGGIVGFCVESGELVSSHRPSQDSRVSAELDRREFDISSLMTIPLRSTKANGNRVVGALHLFNKLRGTFTAMDARIMSRAADLCAGAIANARLYETSADNEARSAALVSIGKELSAELDVNKLLRRILDHAVNLLNADRSALFLVDEDKEELRTLLADKVEEIRIPMTEGVVGHVVMSGESLNIIDAYKDKRFHADVDKMTGYHTATILCVAITNQHGNTLGAVEVVNKKGGHTFTPADQSVLESLASICGIAISNSRLHMNTNYDRLKAEYLSQIATDLTMDVDIVTILQNIIDHARNLLKAAGTAVWILDRETEEMVQVGTNSSKRFPRSRGIIGHVLSTGETVNEANPSDLDPRFHQDVDRFRGGAPKSVLCMDIRDANNNQLLGCVALYNKEGTSSGFSQEDETTLKAFLVFAGIALSRSQSKFLEHLSKHVFPDSELALRASLKHVASGIVQPGDETARTWLSGEHETDEYLVGKNSLADWDFNLFEFEDDRNIFLILDMFKSLNLIDNFNLPLNKMCHFLFNLRATYIDVPYHNWSHGADVGQTTYALLLQNTMVLELLTEVEVMSMMVGALCHDMGHPGVNNAYQIMTRTGIATIYNDMSVLENYHAARAFSMLSESSNNFLADLDDTRWKDFRKGVITVILATDMGRHFDILKKCNARLEEGSDLDSSSAADRTLVMEIMMKCADISNVAKPFNLASEWADRLLEEFFRQGDMERAQGLPVTPFMDKSQVTKPKSQIGFMNFMAMPLFGAAAKLVPPMEKQLQQLKDNVAVYQKQVDDEKAAAEKAGGGDK